VAEASASVKCGSSVARSMATKEGRPVPTIVVTPLCGGAFDHAGTAVSAHDIRFSAIEIGSVNDGGLGSST
jgi:hypothetical protein